MERFKGNPGSEAVRIGTIRLTERRTFHNASYETASWWSECECEPQTVELRSNGYYVFWRFEGVRTDEHFVNRLLWASNVAEKRHIGEPDSHSFMPYNYDFANGLIDGTLDYEVELDAGWSVAVTKEWETPSIAEPGKTQTLKLSGLFREAVPA